MLHPAQTLHAEKAKLKLGKQTKKNDENKKPKDPSEPPPKPHTWKSAQIGIVPQGTTPSGQHQNGPRCEAGLKC